VISGTIYVNIAGYHVKAVRTALSGKASGLFVGSLYASAACAGYMGYQASTWGWATAANIQIIGISIAGGLISLALHPADLMLAPQPALDRDRFVLPS
jgi:MFS transporter, DHA1 family, inner membrane transport protein